MITDEIYELCQPVLEDKELEEEDKVEKLEELLRKQTTFTVSTLENTILDALWRHRNASKHGGAEPPFRHTIIRKTSPAPWQIPRASTPLGSPPPTSSSSPAAPPGFTPRPSFSRQKSTAPSPFTSPRPSPSFALAHPIAHPIPHSPNLNAYEFSDTSPAPDIYGDFGSDNVDWLVADDTASNASSTGTGQLSASAPEWVPQPDMGPYDILRSVLGDRKTNDEIEEALEKNSYDLGATIAQLTEADAGDQPLNSDASQYNGSVLVGKSMNMEQVRPVTPNTGKSPIVCKYWLASGSCLRADCRFAHDAANHVCKYWLAGNCLAGDSCQFSHDPSALVSALSTSDSPIPYGTPPQIYHLQDQYEQFPTLQSGSRSNSASFNIPANGQVPTFTPMSQQRTRSGHQQNSSRPQSRPTSRHQHRPQLSAPSVDDPEAFPTLASLNAKRASKHHGQRSRQGHNNMSEKDGPGSLADVVRTSPSPACNQRRIEAMKKVRSTASSESAAAQKIPQPQHIPWLETGERANQQYQKHRRDAINHGTVRNKFLQSAAQAWNRHDTRAAKALSLRGQAENDLMRKAHREAAKALYEERNQHLINNTAASHNTHDEFYIDLHGLHPEEAVEYLENVLVSHARLGRRIVYAITGTGHHSKNGKDKVGKAVRNWLNELGYTFREFSVPGERGGYIGGVLGIDATSGSKRATIAATDKDDKPVAVVGGKIQLLKREETAT